MCGRYTIADPEAILRELEELGVREFDLDLAPRYNLAPSQAAPIVATGAPERAVAGRWGFVPAWARKREDAERPRPMINARAETAARKPAFRDAARRRRCLVPADGYYEWKPEGGRKQPYYIRARSGRPFVFAGLWAPMGEGETDQGGRTFAILTTEADDLVAPIHDRMPLILGERARAEWLVAGELRPDDAQRILARPDPPAMEAYPVSPAVGSPAKDDPSCIRPLPRQRDLFGGA